MQQGSSDGERQKFHVLYRHSQKLLSLSKQCLVPKKGHICPFEPTYRYSKVVLSRQKEDKAVQTENHNSSETITGGGMGKECEHVCFKSLNP